MEFPSSLLYAPTHEWIRIEGTKGVVGITDFAQNELGDLVYVELPDVGKLVKAGEPCAVVESVKTASDIYSPLDGKVTRVNTALQGKPELINEDAFGTGWIFEIELSAPAQRANLLTAEKYQDEYAH
ncbi:glycine cleavage system protein GcvH [bacterium]|nr:glycine cleavage system protein GcvH [bacterium]